MRKFNSIAMLCLCLAIFGLAFMSFDAEAIENSGMTSVFDEYSFSIDVDEDNEIKWDWTSDDNLSFLIMYTGTPDVIVTQTQHSKSGSGSFTTTDSGSYLIQWTNGNLNATKLTYKITYTQTGDKVVNTCCCGAMPLIALLLCPLLVMTWRK
jgi:hypothetical protein